MMKMPWEDNISYNNTVIGTASTMPTDYDRHTHCIICSKYKSLGNETDQHDYICEECMSSFPADYILFRLKCHKEGIWLKQFDNLEMRLSGIELEEKDLYEKEHTFNWEEENERKS